MFGSWETWKTMVEVADETDMRSLSSHLTTFPSGLWTECCHQDDVRLIKQVFWPCSGNVDPCYRREILTIAQGPDALIYPGFQIGPHRSAAQGQPDPALGYGYVQRLDGVAGDRSAFESSDLRFSQGGDFNTKRGQQRVSLGFI